MRHATYTLEKCVAFSRPELRRLMQISLVPQSFEHPKVPLAPGNKRYLSTRVQKRPTHAKSGDILESCGKHWGSFGTARHRIPPAHALSLRFSPNSDLIRGIGFILSPQPGSAKDRRARVQSAFASTSTKISRPAPPKKRRRQFPYSFCRKPTANEVPLEV